MLLSKTADFFCDFSDIEFITICNQVFLEASGERGRISNKKQLLSLYTGRKIFRVKNFTHFFPAMIDEERFYEYLDTLTNNHEGLMSWTELDGRVIHTARLEDIAKRMMQLVRAYHTISQLTTRGVLVDIVSLGCGVDTEGDLVKPTALDDTGFMLHGHPEYMACSTKKKVFEVGQREPTHKTRFQMPEDYVLVVGYDSNGLPIETSVFEPEIPMERGTLSFAKEGTEEPRYVVENLGDDPPTFAEKTLTEVLDIVNGGLSDSQFLFPVRPWQLTEDLDRPSGAIAVARFTGERFDGPEGFPPIPLNEVVNEHDSNLASIIEDEWTEHLENFYESMTEKLDTRYDHDDQSFS